MMRKTSRTRQLTETKVPQNTLAFLTRFLADKQGLTLVEILVAMFLIAMLLSITYPVFVNALRNWGGQEEAARMASNAMLAMMNLERDIRESEGCEVDENDPSSLTVNYEGRRIIYTLENGDLFREEQVKSGENWNTLTTRVAAAGVESVTFSLVNAENPVGVRIQLSVGNESRNLPVSSIVCWRN